MEMCHLEDNISVLLSSFASFKLSRLCFSKSVGHTRESTALKNPLTTSQKPAAHLLFGWKLSTEAIKSACFSCAEKEHGLTLGDGLCFQIDEEFCLQDCNFQTEWTFICVTITVKNSYFPPSQRDFFVHVTVDYTMLFQKLELHGGGSGLSYLWFSFMTLPVLLELWIHKKKNKFHLCGINGIKTHTVGIYDGTVN